MIVGLFKVLAYKTDWSSYFFFVIKSLWTPNIALASVRVFRLFDVLVITQSCSLILPLFAYTLRSGVVSRAALF